MVCLGNMCMATVHKGDNDAIIIIIIIIIIIEYISIQTIAVDRLKAIGGQGRN